MPELARAQQTGLFPLAPIKRQRVPCDQEDPIYKIYKHQYFGYHPTCWRQFPTGWGCPSPTAPDKEKSFKKIPFGGGEPRGELPPGEGEEGMEAQPGVTRPAMPPLPGAVRSPFETGRASRTARELRAAAQDRCRRRRAIPFETGQARCPATPQPGQATSGRARSCQQRAGTVRTGRSARRDPGSPHEPNETAGDPNDRDEVAPDARAARA